MKKIILTIGILATIQMMFAQEVKTTDINNIPYIEVTGTAEKEIIPDKIFVHIDIFERFDGKEKFTVEQQETQLKEGLKKIGIPLEKLTLSDASSDYVKIKWGKKDVIKQSEYTLLLADADEVTKTFQLLDDINIKGAYISKTDHSKIIEFKKEVRISAIKTAKEKAIYLLEAIGEKVGEPLIINEINNNGFVQSNFQYSPNRGGYANQSYISSDKPNEEPKDIMFEKIKVSSTYYIKFSIAK